MNFAKRLKPHSARHFDIRFKPVLEFCKIRDSDSPVTEPLQQMFIIAAGVGLLTLGIRELLVEDYFFDLFRREPDLGNIRSGAKAFQKGC